MLKFKSDKTIYKNFEFQIEGSENLDLNNEYNINNLIFPYLKECAGDIKKCFSLMPPDLSLIEKTQFGNIYYENEIASLINSLLSYYTVETFDGEKTFKNLKTDTLNQSAFINFNNDFNEKKKTIPSLQNINNKVKFTSLTESTLIADNIHISQLNYSESFQKLIDFISNFFSKNYVFLEDFCVFNDENLKVFDKIPENIVELILLSLEGSKFGINEIKFGINLMKVLSGSELIVKKFIKLGGFEMLYNILLINNNSIDVEYFINSGNRDEFNEFTIPLQLKIHILELIYMLLSHRQSISKFLNKTEKLKYVYFNISEINPNDPDLVNIRRNLNPNYVSRKENTKKKRGKSNSSNSTTSSKNSQKFQKQLKLKNGYQIVLSLILSNRKNIIVNSLIQKIIYKTSFCLYLKEIDKSFKENKEKEVGKEEVGSEKIDKVKNLNSLEHSNLLNNMNSINTNTFKSTIPLVSAKINSFQNVNMDRLAFLIKKLYTYFVNQNVDYKKAEEEEDGSSYPFTHHFVSCNKTNKYFYNKLEINMNLKSSLGVHSKETGMINNKLTNELAKMLEQYNLIENICMFISNPFVVKSKNYYYCCYLFKTLISYLINMDGGINFFSKNYSNSMLLLETLNVVSDNFRYIQNIEEILNQKNFFSISDFQTHPDYFYSKINDNFNQNQAEKQMSLGKVLIYKNIEISSLDLEFNIKVHWLQLKNLIEENLKLISKLDDLKASKNEEDFADRSLTILMYISANCSKSNLSKQALTSIFTNSICFQEILSFINYIAVNCLNYEAHFTLIFEIFFAFFSCSINNKKIGVFLVENGGQLYTEIQRIYNALTELYEIELQEPTVKSYIKKFHSLINMLQCTFIINTGSNNINKIMEIFNEACYSNVQKYGLHDFDKPISENNFKDSIKDYIKNMRMNLLEYKNNDIFFLGELETKGSLMNNIFLTLRVLNTAISFNSLLLIDTIGNHHLHLALRYLIINSTETLRACLTKQEICLSDYKNTVNDNNKFELIDKSKLVKEISQILLQSFEILTCLLRTLLASHVDNFRDNFILDSSINLFLILVDFLGNTYSEKQEINDFELSVVCDLHLLYESLLFFIKEVLKFNTTIKLSFENIVGKFAETPENRPGLLLLINIFFKCVKHEFSLEIFLDVIKKKLVPYSTDLCSALENSIKSQVVKIEELAKDSCLANYIIKLGQETSNDFICYLSGQLMINIMTASFKVEKELILHDFLIKSILLEIKNSYEKIKVSYIFLESNEIEELLPNLDILYKNLKYSIIFLQSEYKFLFIFQDISQEYLNIYIHLMDFIFSSVFSKNEFRRSTDLYKKMKNKIYDICILLLNCFNCLLDINTGYCGIVNENFEIFNSLSFDDEAKGGKGKTNQFISNCLGDELPSKEQIILIIKEFKKILEPNDAIREFFITKAQKPKSTSFVFYINSVISTLEILEKLSKTFYGQLILTHSDYQGGVKLSSNPILSLTPLLNLVTNQISINNQNYQNVVLLDQDLLNSIENQERFIKIIIQSARLLTMLMYDLQYYEYVAYKNYEENKSNDMIFNFFTSNPNIKNIKKFPLTESRLESIIRMFLTNNEALEESLKKNKSLKDELFSALSVKLIFLNSLPQIPELDFLVQLFSNPSCIDLQNDHSQIKIKQPRPIIEKLEIFLRYQEIVFTQKSSCRFIDLFDDPDLEFAECELLYINKLHSNFFFSIPDFDKLLSWKKHRICLLKEFNTDIRDGSFNLDRLVSIKQKDLGSRSISAMKNSEYINRTPFNRYVNILENERLEIYGFSFLSNLITENINYKKFYFTLSSKECFSQLEPILYNCTIDNKEKLFSVEVKSK